MGYVTDSGHLECMYWPDRVLLSARSHSQYGPLSVALSRKLQEIRQFWLQIRIQRAKLPYKTYVVCPRSQNYDSWSWSKCHDLTYDGFCLRLAYSLVWSWTTVLQVQTVIYCFGDNRYVTPMCQTHGFSTINRDYFVNKVIQSGVTAEPCLG